MSSSPGQASALSPALKPVVVAADLEANRSQTLQPVVAQPAQVASAYCARDSGRRLRTRTEEIRDGSVRRVLLHRQLRAGRLGTGLGGDFENKGWATKLRTAQLCNRQACLRCWVKVAVDVVLYAYTIYPNRIRGEQNLEAAVLAQWQSMQCA